MKNIIFLFLLLLVFSSCKDNLVAPSDKWKITPAENKNISDKDITNFKEIAANLAFFEVGKMEYNTQPVEIPTEIIDFYFNSLVHLHNNLAPAQRETIFYIYKLAEEIPYLTHIITLGSDSVYLWMNNWLENKTLTGYEPVDSLLIKYNLQLTYALKFTFTSSIFASFKSEKSLNISKLCKVFRGIPEIKYADPMVLIGTGHWISAGLSEDGKFVKFKFSFGWGDCPSGCINHHYWEFEVYLDGTVKYLRSYGDPLPINW